METNEYFVRWALQCCFLGAMILCRFKTKLPRWVFYCVFVAGASAIRIGTSAYFGTPVDFHEVFATCLYMAVFAALIDRARLSQLAGRRTII